MMLVDSKSFQDENLRETLQEHLNTFEPGSSKFDNVEDGWNNF